MEILETERCIVRETTEDDIEVFKISIRSLPYKVYGRAVPGEECGKAVYPGIH